MISALMSHWVTPDSPDKCSPPRGTWQPRTMGKIPDSGLGERVALGSSSVTHRL